jgi:hypothetical protein
VHFHLTIQKHPTTVVEVQDKHLDPAQAQKHVFQGFDMFSNSYMFHGKPFNDICNIK